MTISSSPMHSKIKAAKGKTFGWAAFDLKQRQKDGLETELSADPFPPMPDITSSGPTRNIAINDFSLMKPFSSVVQPASDFPTLTSVSRIRMPVDDSKRKPGTPIAEESSMAPVFAKLKGLYSWVDESLIQDILEAVNNDEDQACAFLEDMVLSCSEEPLNVPTFVAENHPHNERIKPVNEAFQLENHPCDRTGSKDTSGHVFSVPIEPEWEDDDLYLRHRKEAIKMMRSAAQHSCAANNAFMRGDHFSAQHFSSKAHEEWLAAEKLNAKAAKEILQIRNVENDIWKLDLHGLHASEAIYALEERLHRIETQMSRRRSVSSDAVDTSQTRIVLSPSVGSSSAMHLGANVGKYQALSVPRKSTLQVITGTGNHSRGQASLPIAVKSFLTEKGYRFDDARPGVFAVRPKFCHSLCAK